MSEKWTPEALGRHLFEQARQRGCNTCTVQIECEQESNMPCLAFEAVLIGLNERGIPAPEHVCKCSKEEQCSKP